MKEKLLLFVLFLLSTTLLLVAAVGYSLFSVFMVRRLDPQPYFPIIPAVMVSLISLGVYLLFEYIVARYLRITRMFFAFTTLIIPLFIFTVAIIFLNSISTYAAVFSGGITISLTLILLLCIRYLLFGKRAK